MAAGGILGVGLLGAFAVASEECAAVAGQLGAVDVGKSQFLHVGNVQFAALFVDVANGVRADVTKVCRVGQCADACAVQYDQDRSFFHANTSTPYNDRLFYHNSPFFVNGHRLCNSGAQHRHRFGH